MHPEAEGFVPTDEDREEEAKQGEVTDDFLESAPEIENEETPVIREILVTLPKRRPKELAASVGSPEVIVEGPILGWRIAELRDGVRTGWTHPYKSKESADKKAYWMNQNSGALSYLVEPDPSQVMSQKPSLLPSEHRNF
jgi:hypothetical protein